MEKAEVLRAKIEAAEAALAALQREAAQGPCREFGHDWKFLGGANAGCADWCDCSVPVHVCSKCGDCDYGDNNEGDEIRRECAADAIASGAHERNGDD
jgi:hypothetical protein